MANERQWTGSVTHLPESMRGLALEFMNKSREHSDSPLSSYLADHAYTLSEWADAIEQLYAPIAAPADASTEVPTNAQGIALARFLRPEFRDSVHPGERSARVSRGGMGLSDDYLLVQLASGYAGGIDREGKTST